MVRRLKRLYLDVLFELYGMLHKWFIGKARRCLEDDKQQAFDYWAHKAENCINERDYILEMLFS